MNNRETDNAKGIDVVIAMYNFIEYITKFKRHQEVYCNTTEMSQP